MENESHFYHKLLYEVTARLMENHNLFANKN